MGGGESGLMILLNEMKQTKTWGKEYLDLTMVLCSLNEIRNIITFLNGVRMCAAILHSDSYSACNLWKSHYNYALCNLAWGCF